MTFSTFLLGFFHFFWLPFRLFNALLHNDLSEVASVLAHILSQRHKDLSSQDHLLSPSSVPLNGENEFGAAEPPRKKARTESSIYVTTTSAPAASIWALSRSCRFTSYTDVTSGIFPTSTSYSETSMKFKLLWTYDLVKCVDASPLILCTMKSLYQSQHQLQQQFQQPRKQNTKCAVIIGSHAKKMASVCAETGTMLWETPVDGRIERLVLLCVLCFVCYVSRVLIFMCFLRTLCPYAYLTFWYVYLT